MADRTASRRTGRTMVPPDTSCFVIMPYGLKEDAKGKEIDFEDVYDNLIEPAIHGVGIADCVRSDKYQKPGGIHSDMLNDIYTADVAVVDISALNPNVFYELGIRHALAGRVTVLIRDVGTTIPFNIQDERVIKYTTTQAGFAQAQQEIEAFVRNGLRSSKPDSPVHKALPLKIGRAPAVLPRCEFLDYKLRSRPDKRVGLVTGELRRVKGVDIWVNSENTYMQMARHFDPSISGVIRFHGAEQKNGIVVDDLIANELAQEVGENPNVTPATVIVTGSGKLEEKNGVKHVFHVAAVTGQVGQGYFPIPCLTDCVDNALDVAAEERFAATNPTSILFPLLGTGTGRADVEEKAPGLIRAAIDHLAQHPSSRITRVYFLVRDKRQLEVCREVLDEAKDVVRVRRGG